MKFAFELLKILWTPKDAASPPSGATKSNEGFAPTDRLSFDETVAHLHRGYEHTQRTVQFMDTKAAAVVALCLAIFAFVGKLIAWLYDKVGEGILQGKAAPGVWVIWGLVILLTVVGASGFWCLDRAFRTVRPNSLPQPKHFTALFPAMDKAYEHPDAISYLERFKDGEARVFVIGEYKHQLLAMGHLVHLKISRLRQSIQGLWIQGLFSMLLAIAIGATAGFGILPKKPSEEAKPTRVILISEPTGTKAQGSVTLPDQQSIR